MSKKTKERIIVRVDGDLAKVFKDYEDAEDWVERHKQEELDEAIRDAGYDPDTCSPELVSRLSKTEVSYYQIDVVQIDPDDEEVKLADGTTFDVDEIL